MSDLAQELTRDPHCFAFTGLRERYNERQLKDALVDNTNELSKLYPEKVEGTIPSIEEIEARLGQMNDDKLI